MSELTGDWERVNNILNTAKLSASMRRCAARVGNYGASEVKKGIISGAPGGQTFKPLSDLTIARRQPKSIKPLVNHGDLVGSVNYQVFNNENSVFIGVKKGIKRKDGKDAVQIAAVHENGCIIAVTPKMRAYLHYQGIHLKKETTQIYIPPRPFLKPILQSANFISKVGEIYVRALKSIFYSGERLRDEKGRFVW